MSANPDRVPTDAELLAAVAEGDPEAFGVLYDQHAPWLLVRLRQRTADADLADQVAQALWRNWDLLTSPATSLERLGGLVGVQPPPARAATPELGGAVC
jgi:hypothetical protein